MNVQFSSVQDDGDDSEAKRSFYEMSDADDSARPGSLIEGMYGVERRRNHPTKKIKTADAMEVRPALDKHLVAISRDTGLGQWMKEGPAKTPSSDVVDLTSGKSIN